jgi:hypothetical protein
MSKSKKIFFILFIIIFCLAVYYPVNFFLKQKNKTSDTNTDGKEIAKEASFDQNGQLVPKKPAENDQAKEQENIIENLLNNESSTPQTEIPTENLNFFINITPPDCTRECEPYKYNEKELQYCQNVCGLSPAIDKEDCEKMEGLEKDYCLKNNAVIDKNLNGCEEITDTKIKETCQHRIQEDFFEENF